MGKDVASQVGPFGFVFHQVAMYTNNFLPVMRGYHQMGYHDWTHDEATLRGVRHNGARWTPAVFEAEMHFNYEVSPLEMEFLTYFGTGHRHEERGRLSAVPFISHMSVHVESVPGLIHHMAVNHNMLPYHLFVTESHTNPAIRGKKRFIECVYDTRAAFGYDIKAIQRVGWDIRMRAEDLVQIVETHR